MSIIQSLSSLASFGRVRINESAPQGLKPYAEPAPVASADLRRARRGLLALYRSLEELAERSAIESRFKLDLPDARSADSLALDLSTTAAFLQSSEEINTAPMSFAPFGPDWGNGSDALITIGGVYDGSNGSGTLSFEVRRDGIRGVDNLRIRVEDPQGSRIRNVNIRRNDPLDQQYDLLNGLYLTLGNGALIDRDTTTIQVFDNAGAVVDPDKPLGGIRNDNPNLEFGGPSIVDGSFAINGQNVAVATSDTLNEVINRINESAAGVTASFNAATDTIDFLQDTTGSVPTITLSGDTSNFLAATKLSGASVIPGIDPDNEKILGDVGALSSIQAGSFRINGQDIAIDPSTDSLDDVIDRINTESSGVVASFDPDTRRVLIESQDNEAFLTLDGNGTGLFDALRMPEGRVDPEAKTNGISRRRSYGIADATTAAFDELNYLFRDASFKSNSVASFGFRGPLESALRGAFGVNGDNLFGLVLDDSRNARRRGDFITVDRRDFTDNLQRRGDAVQEVLGGNDDNAGLIGRLLLATRQSLTLVNRQLGLSGSVIDTFA